MKYRVVMGDPFGGYTCIKADLDKDVADELATAETLKVDYFTSVLVVEDDHILFKNLTPMMD